MFKRFMSGAAISALSLAVTAPIVQAQQTTSAIRGELVSTGGGAIANARVEIVHVPTGAVTTATSNGAGIFDARGLIVGGPYNVKVQAKGFEGQAFENVYLSLGDALRLDAALEPAVTDIVVTAKRVARPTDVGSRTTLGKESIGSVVTPRRDIRDIARRDPLVTIDNVTRGTGPTGGIYIAGSTPRLNRITIDGVRSADDFGLNTGGLSTTRGPVSISAIEQLAVQAVPFDVEDGDFTGGAVNIVLRAGSNDFRGSIFANYQNDGMVGERIKDRDSPAIVHLENYGGFLSGPIWKDKAFFAASYEYYDALEPNAFNGPIDQSFVNTINGLGGTAGVGVGGPTGRFLTTGDLAGVTAAYSTYAVSSRLPIGNFPIVTPTKDVKNSMRIDFNVAPGHRLQASYRHADSALWKVAGGATAISPVNNWYIQGEIEDNYSLQLNSKWTSAFSTEVRGSFRSYIRGQNPPLGQGFSNVQICLESTASGDPFNCGNTNTVASSPTNRTPAGLPTLNIGPDQFRQANVLKTKNTSGHFTGTYALDRHLIKGGIQSKQIDIFNLFVPQARGVFYFDSIQNFQNGIAGSLLYQNNPSGDPRQAAADFKYAANAVFLQDSWDITDKLTINFGVRHDFYQSDDKPALNTRFKSRYGYDNQTTYDGISVTMPRFSAKWRASDNVQISGGVGLFSGGLPDVFLSNSFSNTGVLTNSVNIQRLGDGTFRENNSSTVIDAATGNALLNVNKATFGTGVPAAANALLSLDSVLRRTAGTASLAPNFEMPSDYKANLSGKFDLWGGLRLTGDVVLTQSNENLAFRDIRARPLTVNGVQLRTPDGRLRYDGLNITAANRTAQGLPVASDPDLVNLGGNTDIQAYNSDNGNYIRTWAVSVGKSWDSLGLDASLAYVSQSSRVFGSLAEFATTPGGFYSEQFTDVDPNTAAKGRSTNEIKDQYKLQVNWTKNFVGDLATRFTLFGEFRSGRPYSYTMTDAAAGRGPVFGVNRGDQLLYVPNVNAPDAANPLRFTSPTGTTVFFDSTATLTNFRNLVNREGLPVNEILPKGFGTNRSVSQVDLQIAQELPLPFTESKASFTVDFKNFLNLLNDRWGVVEEFGSGRGGAGDRVISVQCADSAGVAQNATSSVCSSYRYSNFNSSAGSASSGIPNVDTSSRWAIVMGLKYEF